MHISTDIYQRIVAAKIFIDENFHQDIDLDRMAQEAFLSRFHFHRLFRKIYNRTPHQYLRRKRIDKARDLLAENRGVMEVCNEVGFESLGSFSLLFKKEIGYAPHYYRNLAYQKKKESLAQPAKVIPHCFIEGFQLTGSGAQPPL